MRGGSSRALSNKRNYFSCSQNESLLKGTTAIYHMISPGVSAPGIFGEYEYYCNQGIQEAQVSCPNGGQAGSLHYLLYLLDTLIIVIYLSLKRWNN